MLPANPAISMLVHRNLSSESSLKVLVNSAQHIIHVSSSTAISLVSTVILSLDDIAAHDAEEENDEDFMIGTSPPAYRNEPCGTSGLRGCTHMWVTMLMRQSLKWRNFSPICGLVMAPISCGSMDNSGRQLSRRRIVQVVKVAAG